MKQAITLSLALALGAICFWQFQKSLKSEENLSKHVVAILQTTSHPALDTLKDSFKQNLKEIFKNDIEFIDQNGFGQMNALQMMAQNFHREAKIELILAIGTPAIQIMASIEKDKPILFAAVTDPKTLNLDFDKSNLYGISDSVDATSQVSTILNAFPKTGRIGLLYTSNEVNSQSAANDLKSAIESKGLDVELAAIESANEIPQVLGAATNKCDLILAPTDHLVATSMPLISKITTEAKCPLIVSDVTLCIDGQATAAFGVDYQEVGHVAANMAFSLLQKQAPIERVLKVKADWVVNQTNYKKITNQ